MVQPKAGGMQAFVIAGLGALCVMSVAVGAKLLRLAGRTGGFPERTLGLFFLLGGGVGYPLSALAALFPDWHALLSLGSSLFTGVSQVMLFLFTARVFRAGDWRGRVGIAIGVGLVLTYVLGYSISNFTASGAAEVLRAQMVWGGVSLVMSGAAYGWTSFESLRHYLRSRKRLAIGLGDPVASNRMLLWALMGLTTIGVVVVDAVLLYSVPVFAREVAIPLVTCGGGLVVGVILILAFFPPQAYVDAIRRQATAA